jgi:uncharacterized membrane protein YhaH (DUF805 family)
LNTFKLPTWNNRGRANQKEFILHFVSSILWMFVTMIGVMFFGGMVAGAMGGGAVEAATPWGLAFVGVTAGYFGIALWCGAAKRFRDIGLPGSLAVIGWLIMVFTGGVGTLVAVILMFIPTGALGDPVIDERPTMDEEHASMIKANGGEIPNRRHGHQAKPMATKNK